VHDEVAMGRKARGELVLRQVERDELMALTLRRKTAQALALRARIVLGRAEGIDKKAVAARQRVTQQTATSGSSSSWTRSDATADNDARRSS
jgi:hypothetical protein